MADSDEGTTITEEASPVLEPVQSITPTPVDSFDPRPDGSITITFGGIVYHLKAPTIGQFEVLMGQLYQIVEQAEGVDDKTSVSARFDLVLSSAERGYRFLSDTWTALEADGLVLPDKNSIPAWLVGGEFGGKLIVQWQRCPPVPGAK